MPSPISNRGGGRAKRRSEGGRGAATCFDRADGSRMKTPSDLEDSTTSTVLAKEEKIRTRPERADGTEAGEQPGQWPSQIASVLLPMRKAKPFVRRRIHLIVSVAVLTGPAALLSCSTTHREADTSDATAEPANQAGMHNLHRVTEAIWSGPVPDGDADFATLEALGIKTVISVDAGTPDLERIHAHNMRSIHLPIRYAGIKPDTQLALARAVRESDGPVFIHCHHGKHRGPAAAATAAIILGDMTPEEGHAFLILAGTSPAYPGLFQCVEDARPIEAAELDAWTGSLPEVAEVGDLPKVMARIGSNFEMLDRLLGQGFKPLPDHPDRTALSEAASMYDAFRSSLEITELAEPRFTEEMRLATELAEQVEAFVRAGDLINADAAFMRLDESCIRCHDVYRGSGMGW